MLGRVSAGVGGREWFIAVLWVKRARQGWQAGRARQERRSGKERSVSFGKNDYLSDAVK